MPYSYVPKTCPIRQINSSQATRDPAMSRFNARGCFLISTTAVYPAKPRTRKNAPKPEMKLPGPINLTEYSIKGLCSAADFSGRNPCQ